MEILAYTHLCLVSQPVEEKINTKQKQFKTKFWRRFLPLILVGTGWWIMDPALASLSFGQRGANIVQLQNQLKQLGYFPNNVAATGYFGSVTRDAVIKFQRDQGLVADGVVGSQTLASLQKGKPAPTTSTPESTPAPATNSRQLPSVQLGSQGDVVKLVQLQLTVFGYYKGEVNSQFNEETRQAVIKFQKEMQVPGDGVVGQRTHELLYQMEEKVFS